jgi:hypothetical protein
MTIRAVRLVYMRGRTTWSIAIVVVTIVVAVLVIGRLKAPGSDTGTAESARTDPTVAPPPSPPAGALQPEPQAPLADVALPAGSVFVGSSSNQEVWRYSAPYDDTVAFLRKQFATGRVYDAQGATWWRDLPPCYDDTGRHQSPPQGWIEPDSTQWLWADDSISLSVKVFRATSGTSANEIVIDYTGLDAPPVCNRS